MTLDSIWKNYTLIYNSPTYWNIGAVTLLAECTQNDWKIGYKVSDSIANNTLYSHSSLSDTSYNINDKTFIWTKYGLKNSPNTIKFIPKMADRSVVVHPELDFCIPKKEEVTLYVSLPLWLSIQIEEKELSLFDQPIFRPSDTWFSHDSSSKSENGELLYSIKVLASTSLSNMPISPYRVISKILIENIHDSQLTLKRLTIPVRNLSIFKGNDNQFYTEQISAIRKKESEFELRLSNSPKINGVTHELFSSPRDSVNSDFISKTLYSFLGR